MAISPAYIGADLNVNLTGMSIASTGAYLNTGTATYVFKDSAGTTIGTGTLAYVAASNGNYAGVIESTVTALLDPDEACELTITFAQAPYNDSRVIPMRAANRTAM